MPTPDPSSRFTKSSEPFGAATDRRVAAHALGDGAAPHARTPARARLRRPRRGAPQRLSIPRPAGHEAVRAGRPAADQQTGPQLPARPARAPRLPRAPARSRRPALQARRPDPTWHQRGPRAPRRRRRDRERLGTTPRPAALRPTPKPPARAQRPRLATTGNGVDTMTRTPSQRAPSPVRDPARLPRQRLAASPRIVLLGHERRSRSVAEAGVPGHADETTGWDEQRSWRMMTSALPQSRTEASVSSSSIDTLGARPGRACAAR